MNWKMKFVENWGRWGMKSELHIAFSAELDDRDSEIQTYGCRANNPDICKNYMLENVCAFTSLDNICKQPSRSWKKQYLKLKEVEND
jgi:hypothetical protein